MQALAQGRLKDALVSRAERALLRFAAQVTKRAYKVTGKDVERLRALGWADDQIAEAVYVTGMFAMMNRVADAFGVPPMGYLKLGKLTP